MLFRSDVDVRDPRGTARVLGRVGRDEPGDVEALGPRGVVGRRHLGERGPDVVGTVGDLASDPGEVDLPSRHGGDHAHPGAVHREVGVTRRGLDGCERSADPASQRGRVHDEVEAVTAGDGAERRAHRGRGHRDPGGADRQLDRAGEHGPGPARRVVGRGAVDDGLGRSHREYQRTRCSGEERGAETTFGLVADDALARTGLDHLDRGAADAQAPVHEAAARSALPAVERAGERRVVDRDGECDAVGTAAAAEGVDDRAHRVLASGAPGRSHRGHRVVGGAQRARVGGELRRTGPGGHRLRGAGGGHRTGHGQQRGLVEAAHVDARELDVGERLAAAARGLIKRQQQQTK